MVSHGYALYARKRELDIQCTGDTVPRRYVDRESALRTVGKALSKGAAKPSKGWVPNLSRDGTTVPHAWDLNFAGNCLNPVLVHRDGVRLHKHEKAHIFGPGKERPVMTEILCPCRQCENCLRRRAAHWRLRAIAEYTKSGRTWFGTLTLSPDAHFIMKMRASGIRAKHGPQKGQLTETIDFDGLAPADQFRARHAEISKEITLYVKRLRKESEASLRLLCVAEAHKSGLPHYHMLVHEAKDGPAIKHATLSGQWQLGYSNWKLVTDAKSASYVCKYLGKSMDARVRASLDYGK